MPAVSGHNAAEQTAEAKHRGARCSRAWADDNAEFIKRAAFALLRALALHDTDAPDENYRQALALIESNASDDRHLVQKAQTMALRAIAQKRPHVRPDVVALASALSSSDNPNARRVGRPISRAFPT